MEIWKRLGLNIPTLMMMAKGATAPTIAIAMYQSEGVREVYSTLGYVIAIISILSFCIMPRAKFIQTVITSVIGTCIAAAMAILVIYCATQARDHTTHSTSPEDLNAYDSSASAISAIWLFFNVWAANTIRVAYPNFNSAAILYSIFLVVTSTWGPQFATMEAGIEFAVRILKAFLTGLALATGVNIFLFPISSRDIVFRESAAYLGGLQHALTAHLSYVESLGAGTVVPGQNLNLPGKGEPLAASNASSWPESLQPAKAQALHQAVKNLTTLQIKIDGDLKFSKREAAIGYLDAADIEEISSRLRAIYRSVLGMSTITRIVEKITSRNDPCYSKESHPISEGAKDSSGLGFEREKQEWTDTMRSIHNPSQTLIDAMNEGLEHVAVTLRLPSTPAQKKARGAKGDVEASGGSSKPGPFQFSRSLEERMERSFEQQGARINRWRQANGVAKSEHALLEPSESLKETPNRPQSRILFFAIYMEHLLHCTANEILIFARFADSKVADGTMKKRRLLLPSMQRVKKWLFSIFKHEDSVNLSDPLQSAIQLCQLPQGKDPEHLPPSNAWEKFSDATIRNVPRILRSISATFGFRVACALLTVAIPNFLHDSQSFFIHQRGLWAETTVAISMSGNAGLSFSGYTFRIIGSIFGAAASLAMYYIPNGNTAGIIIFLWIFMFLEYYVVIKLPRFTIGAIIAMTTELVIVGYTLQVRKIGVKAATASGQIYLPIYELAPYRLAVICIGLASAFFWTIFPYPITARSRLREDLGAALFTLANLSSSVHATVKMRLRRRERDTNFKSDHEGDVEKARERLLERVFHLLLKLREDSAHAAWEPTIGGKFPKQQYDVIIDRMHILTAYISLISDGTQSFAEERDSSSAWINRFSELTASLNSTSLGVASVLAILAACVSGGQPLPSSLSPSQPDHIRSRLAEMDGDITNISHMVEPGYSALVTLQIASILMNDELGELIKSVKSLVGEVDFFAHTSLSSGTALDETRHPQSTDGRAARGKLE